MGFNASRGPLSLLWKRLQTVASLRFTAISQSATGWTGGGTGQVTARLEKDDLIFEERGSWTPPRGAALRFFNTFRWSVHGDRLRLEHLRYGADRPVFLFDLAHRDGAQWSDAEPHHCADDRYSAFLTVADDSIVLAWTIQGPRKNESIEYVYR